MRAGERAGGRHAASRGASGHAQPWLATRRQAARSRRARHPAAAPLSPRSQRARLALVAIGTIGGLLALGARCAHLQIVRAPELLGLARSQQEREIVLDPHRGPIVDRNGKELALSLEVDSVYADPSGIGDPAAAARRLAPLLGLKVSDLRQRLGADRQFTWVKRKITPDQKSRVAKLGMTGIGFVRESRRYYPKRGLAAHVLGACGMDNQGLAGLEFAYDKPIKGTPGRMQFLRDGHGGRVLDRSRTEPTPGTGLALTLDEVIQHLAERELDAVMADTGAVGAAVVVMQPQTGEVLALASRPGFDPNSYPDARDTARHNRAVSDYYEPGSTFKVITAAAALDAGRVRQNEVIWCENGSIVVGNHRFGEDRLPFGNLTLTEVLARSSNVGAIKIARRLEPREFHAAIRGFGFGARSGIELSAESPGMLRDPKDWSGLSQASLAMGQEIGVTPLQLAAALSVVAGDGTWRRPHVVGAAIRPGGRRAPAAAVDARRVITETTARALRRMLQSVTGPDGTGRHANVPGYSVGGKTGTAQKIDGSGRYSRDRHVSWFGGFVPVDRPALVIVVMVDEPRGPRFHGGDVAAPVFARIAQPALQYLGVAPDREGTLVFDRSGDLQVRGPGRTGGGDAGRTVTAVKRSRGRDGAGAFDRASMIALPAASAATRTDAGAPRAAGPREIPDLTGMSMRQAIETQAAAGLTCRTERSGPRVTRQQPPPGTPITAGDPCTVTF